MANSAEGPKSPYACDPEQERYHLDGDEKKKQRPADGRGAGEYRLRTESDPPEGKGRADRPGQVQEHTTPRLRAQIRPVSHLESGLNTEEEEM
jgi:hypothetical protein